MKKFAEKLKSQNLYQVKFSELVRNEKEL